MRSRGKFNVDVIDQPTVANIFYHRKSEVLYRQNVELKIDPLGLKKVYRYSRSRRLIL